MNTGAIKLLEKIPAGKKVKKDSAGTSCCGGAPASNEEACCKLDEDKKEAGESGCGCSTTASTGKVSGCC
jgi:hypothetical protein